MSRININSAEQIEVLLAAPRQGANQQHHLHHQGQKNKKKIREGDSDKVRDLLELRLMISSREEDINYLQGVFHLLWVVGQQNRRRGDKETDRRLSKLHIVTSRVDYEEEEPVRR